MLRMKLEDRIAEAIRIIIESVGESVLRPGLEKTPERVAGAFLELTSGYKVNPIDIVKDAAFENSSDGIILVKDIEFFSLCEHHLLPFFGICHIGYVPSGKILGFSKIPRIVDVFSKRFQVQERLTEEIADFIDDFLKPRGVAVFISAYHMCVAMRGISKAKATMTTTSFKGCFKERENQEAFLRMISRGLNVSYL